MHVMTQVRDDERHGRKLAVGPGEAGEGQVARSRHVAEVDPGVVGADIPEREIAAAAAVPGRWHALGVSGESQPGTDQLGTVKQVTRATEDYSYQVMDAQTANNRVGPPSDKNK